MPTEPIEYEWERLLEKHYIASEKYIKFTQLDSHWKVNELSSWQGDLRAYY